MLSLRNAFGKKRCFKTGILIVAVLLPVNQAYANVRHYVWTQEYETLPKGGREIEGYTTLKVPEGARSNENSFQYQGEFEYGVTNHWTLGHYERFMTQNQAGKDDATNYQGFKFESKYRIGEKGKYWVDSLLYLEWATDFRNHDHPNEIEGKVVLSKDFDKMNIAYNQIMESELGRGGRTEQNYAVGVSYELFPAFRVGCEMKGNYWKPSSNKNEIALGPTLAYEFSYFWVSGGAAFGVNHHADVVEARIIVGVPF